MSLFSIILPTYNRCELLKKAIDSVLEQTVEEWTLHVIDDGSVDNTEVVVNSYDDPRINYHYQARSERSGARNHGIKMAMHPYMCFIDDDDYWLPNHLDVFKQYILANDNPQAVLRSGYFRMEHDTFKKSALYQAEKHRNPVHFGAFNMVGIWSLCIPTTFLNELQFPAGYPHWQDTYLFLLLAAKHPFVQLAAHTYIYRIHQDMGSRFAMQSERIMERAAINVAAIHDLFSKHGAIVSPFLPKNAERQLVAEKYLQYANNNMYYGKGEHYLLLLKKSITSGLHARLWKQYLAGPYHWISKLFQSTKS